MLMYTDILLGFENLKCCFFNFKSFYIGTIKLYNYKWSINYIVCLLVACKLTTYLLSSF